MKEDKGVSRSRHYGRAAITSSTRSRYLRFSECKMIIIAFDYRAEKTKREEKQTEKRKRKTNMEKEKERKERQR